MTSHKPLRVGLVGCGAIAPTHAEAYRQVSGVELAWACDLIPARAEALAARYAVPHWTTNFRELLRDPALDAISVCTDHAAHVPIVVAALRAGKHVLCEKALAPNAAGLRRMLAAHAQRPELVFAGVFQHRFDPLLQRLHTWVRDGVFGQMLTGGMRLRCRRTREYYEADAWRGTWDREGGGVLINQAIHFVDALVWIMGGVDALCGAYANLTHTDVIETEDTAAAVLRFRNGAIGTLEATSSSHLDWEYTIDIHGTAGSLEVRDGQPLKMIWADVVRGAALRAELAACHEPPPASAGRVYYGTGHPAQIADFVAAIREHRAPWVPAESARHTVEVVLGVYRSHRMRRWVRLPKHDG